MTAAFGRIGTQTSRAKDPAWLDGAHLRDNFPNDAERQVMRTLPKLLAESCIEDQADRAILSSMILSSRLHEKSFRSCRRLSAVRPFRLSMNVLSNSR